MREGFHYRDGWYFRRGDDGQVVVEVAESAQVDAPLLAGVTLDADSWASVVAAVSAAGETSATFKLAKELHWATAGQAADLAAESAAPGRHPATAAILRYFAWRHLPQKLQEVSIPFCVLAERMADTLPPGPEVTAGLRKLLEAKDCAVRAALDLPPREG